MSKRFGSETEAAAWLERQERLIALGVWMPENAEKAEARARSVLFRDYALAYVEERRRADGSPIGVTTRQKYGQYLRCWILPAFGSLRVRDVSFLRVRRFYDSLPADKAGHGMRNRQAVMALLNGILNAACRMQPDGSPPLIRDNPCEAIRVASPKARRRDVDVSASELKALADAMPVRYRLALYLIGVCGLRPGEVLALKREDVGDGYVTVDEAAKDVWKPLPDGHRRRHTVVGLPKTESSMRRALAPDALMGMLMEHMREYVGSAPDALLFPGRSGGPMSPQSLRNMWYRARKAVPRIDGERMRLYDLRHRAISLMASYAYSDAAVMEQAGHTRLATDLRYRHGLEADRRLLAAGMERDMAGA